MPGLLVNLSDEEAAAVQWLATRRGITSAQLLRQALRNELESVVRLYRDRVWEVRKRVLERDAILATQVDAAAEAP